LNLDSFYLNVTIIKIISFYWTMNTQYNAVVCVYNIPKSQNNNLYIIRQKPDTNLFTTSYDVVNMLE